MMNTSHSQPCAVVPDAVALSEKPDSVAVALNQGRNSEMRTTSEAMPAILSGSVHRLASKLNAEDPGGWAG
jgi:hypothetical protein